MGTKTLLRQRHRMAWRAGSGGLVCERSTDQIPGNQPLLLPLFRIRYFAKKCQGKEALMDIYVVFFVTAFLIKVLARLLIPLFIPLDGRFHLLN